MSDRVKAESASRPHGVQIAVSLSGNFGENILLFHGSIFIRLQLPLHWFSSVQVGLSGDSSRQGT